ncbi:MAG: hypothetical protein ACM3W4_02030 [Ignavibacteriales bacterium]
MPPVVIAAAVTAGGAIIGGALSSHGQQKAADAQVQAANQANQTQLQIYNQQRAYAEPWRQMGLQALGRLGQLYNFSPTASAGSGAAYRPPTTGGNVTSGTGGMFPGLAGLGNRIFDMNPQQLSQWKAAYGQWNAGHAGGGAQPQTNAFGGAVGGQSQPQPQSTQQWLAMDPGYQFRLTEGMNALNTGFAARGMLKSGAAAKAALQYGQNYASNEFGNAYSRLSALAGIGQTVNQSNNALGQNYANNVSNNLMQAGQARATSYANQGAIWGNTLGQVAGAAANAYSPQRPGY